MSFYNDGTKDNPNIIIDGVVFPFTSKPIKVTPQLITDGGRLADSIDYEGSVKGIKHTIVLTYDVLNKEHFDTVYRNTMGKYEAGNKDMFFDINIPTYTPNGIKKYTVYLGASSFSSHECTMSTEREYLDTGDSAYNYGGSKYDELHENIEIQFVEK
jgi:hypothetical protein